MEAKLQAAPQSIFWWIGGLIYGLTPNLAGDVPQDKGDKGKDDPQDYGDTV